jgi:hypothetical protein
MQHPMVHSLYKEYLLAAAMIRALGWLCLSSVASVQPQLLIMSADVA